MTSYLSRHSGDGAVPPAQLAFVGRRLKNDLHDLILRAFMKEGLSQADLALRMGVDKSQISRWLGAPGNLTIETVAKLMFAINGSLVAVATIDNDASVPANFTQPGWMIGKFPPLPSTSEGAHAVLVSPVSPNVPVAGGSSINFAIRASSLEPTQNIPTIKVGAE